MRRELGRERRAVEAPAGLSNRIQHSEQSFDRQAGGGFVFLMYCVPSAKIPGSASSIGGGMLEEAGYEGQVQRLNDYIFKLQVTVSVRVMELQMKGSRSKEA